MKKKLLLIVPLIVVFTNVIYSQKKGAKSTHSGGRHVTTHFNQPQSGGEQIPTIAWYSIPQSQSTLARYQELKASGITYSYQDFANINRMQTAMDLAQQVGVKMFISCPELSKDPETVVKRFMNHPALAGYFLRDEPNKSDFDGLASLVNRIQRIDKEHVCYINLLPNYATNSQLAAESYDDYINSYTTQVPTRVLSFDHYPIIGSTKNSIRNNWYKNLEIIAAAAKRSGKIFWAFALTTAFDTYPEPTMGMLRLQVYSDLAYGAQAIQYFTYWTADDQGRHNFHAAPITLAGTRSNVYHEIQQLNKEIKNLSYIFLGATVLSVSHTGNIPEGTHPLRLLPKAINTLKITGQGAVVSILKNKMSNYLVVVNHDFSGAMNLTIKCGSGVKKILKDGSAVAQDQTAHTVSVGAGDVAIYSWQTR